MKFTTLATAAAFCAVTMAAPMPGGTQNYGQPQGYQPNGSPNPYPPAQPGQQPPYTQPPPPTQPPTGPPPPPAPPAGPKGTDVVADFESANLITTHFNVWNPFKKTPYQHLTWTGVLIYHKWAINLMPVLKPSSGKNFLQSTPLKRTFGGDMTMSIKDTPAKSFDLHSFKFGCAKKHWVADCDIEVTGTRNGQTVGPITREFKHNGLPGVAWLSSNMQEAKFADEFKGVDSVTIKHGKKVSGINALVRIGVDDVSYTVYE